MRFPDLSLKKLSAIISVLVMVCFVCAYLSIKYFGVYKEALRQVEAIQYAERERVQVALEMSQEMVDNPLQDYAVWDRTAEFIRVHDPEFLAEDLNIHTFAALKLEGVMLFSPRKELIWGQRYNLATQQILPVTGYMPRAALLVQHAERLPVDEPSYINRFMVIDDVPHMMAVAKVCNTAGDDCTKGYILMVRKLTDDYFQRLNRSTGLALKYRILQPEVPDSEQANSSYLAYRDPVSDQHWQIEIPHSVQRPEFVSENEFIALILFGFFLFVFNYFLARAVTKPIDEANAMLSRTGPGQHSLDESRFISREVKVFARNISRVIEELEHKRKILQRESNQDPLTLLANRRKLENFLLDKLSDNKHYVSLFLIDVDHFKLLNDNYGHSRGDRVLRQLAQAFVSVGFEGESLAARYGGEEFCIVCISKDRIDMQQNAKRLIAAVRALGLEHNHSPTSEIVTVSVGGVQMQAAQADDYRRLINHADKSLYLAKKQGRDRYVVETIVPH